MQSNSVRVREPVLQDAVNFSSCRINLSGSYLQGCIIGTKMQGLERRWLIQVDVKSPNSIWVAHSKVEVYE